MIGGVIFQVDLNIGQIGELGRDGGITLALVNLDTAYDELHRAGGLAGLEEIAPLTGRLRNDVEPLLALGGVAIGVDGQRV